MFLTENLTETVAELLDKELSTVTIAGIITAFACCIFVAVAAGVVAYKWRGNAGGALMAFVMGLAGAIVASTFTSVIFTITRAASLTQREESGAVLAGYVLFAVIAAAVSFGIRYYLLYYMDKTGIGKHKGLSVGCGFAAGSSIRYVSNLFYYTVYAIAIKNGTFITEELKASEGYNDAVQFHNQLVQTPSLAYFTYALQFIAIGVFEVLLTLYMTRKWLENDKLKSSFVVAGATLAVELVQKGISGLLSIKVLDEETEYIILVIFFVLLTALSAGLLARVLTGFPHGREKFIKSMRQRAEEAEKKQKRSAWNQINGYMAKTESEESEEAAAAGETEEPEENCVRTAESSAENGAKSAIGETAAPEENDATENRTLE